MRGLHSSEEAYLLLTQHSQKCFKGKIVKVAEANQQRWLEERGQRLDNFDQIHLVLASYVAS